MAERSKRGFAAMDLKEQREIARKGGLASHGGRNGGEDEYDEAEEASEGTRGARNSGSRGGSSEQHARAGRQSHKNS